MLVSPMRLPPRRVLPSHKAITCKMAPNEDEHRRIFATVDEMWQQYLCYSSSSSSSSHPQYKCPTSSLFRFGSPYDLQLAAELGKTLLERNKELETSLKHYQNVVDDQSQEIEYLTKQTAALKEVNNSRLKIYEQLEISIQDLEQNNSFLTQQSNTDKRHIRSLQETIDGLETRCEELERSLNKERSLVVQLEQRPAPPVLSPTAPVNVQKPDHHLSEQVEKLQSQLNHSKRSASSERKKFDQLAEQLTNALKENEELGALLEKMKYEKDDELRHVKEELYTMQQIRNGDLCKRCLRNNFRNLDEEDQDDDEEILSVFSLKNDDDDDDQSIISEQLGLHSPQSLASLVEKIQLEQNGGSEGVDVVANSGANPYRVLVEKYEALVKMQQQRKQWQTNRNDDKKKPENGTSPNKKCMTLQQELQLSGALDHFNRRRQESDDEEEELIASNLTSHKGTQTELLGAMPGAFLCKISDGNDCQFSIYDDASPIDSRFRKTPEYRQLFREIFDVLKRAAEAKDEGEKLPLLDDRVPDEQPAVPPVTPAKEDNPIVESAPRGDNIVEESTEGVKLSKRKKKAANASRADAKCAEGAANRLRLEHSPSPSNSRSNSKRRSGSSKARRKKTEFADEKQRHQQNSSMPVNGGRSDRPRPVSMYDMPSTASQEVAKLKILEKSYADVLRLGTRKKSSVPTRVFYSSHVAQQ